MLTGSRVPGLYSINELDFALDMNCHYWRLFWSEQRENQKIKGQVLEICISWFWRSIEFKNNSAQVYLNSTSRIAAHMLIGIEFLNVGIILKAKLFDNKDSDNPLNRKVVNLTISAST